MFILILAVIVLFFITRNGDDKNITTNFDNKKPKPINLNEERQKSIRRQTRNREKKVIVDEKKYEVAKEKKFKPKVQFLDFDLRVSLGQEAMLKKALDKKYDYFIPSGVSYEEAIGNNWNSLMALFMEFMNLGEETLFDIKEGQLLTILEVSEVDGHQFSSLTFKKEVDKFDLYILKPTSKLNVVMTEDFKDLNIKDPENLIQIFHYLNYACKNLKEMVIKLKQEKESINRAAVSKKVTTEEEVEGELRRDSGRLRYDDLWVGATQPDKDWQRVELRKEINSNPRYKKMYSDLIERMERMSRQKSKCERDCHDMSCPESPASGGDCFNNSITGIDAEQARLAKVNLEYFKQSYKEKTGDDYLLPVISSIAYIKFLGSDKLYKYLVPSDFSRKEQFIDIMSNGVKKNVYVEDIDHNYKYEVEWLKNLEVVESTGNYKSESSNMVNSATGRISSADSFEEEYSDWRDFDDDDCGGSWTDEAGDIYGDESHDEWLESNDRD